MEDISCSICFDPFSGNDHIPKVLECGHTFCSNCLEKLISGNPNGVCSICQKEIVIKESYPTNFAFLSLLDQKEKLKHDTLKLEEVIATFQRLYPDDFKICEENIARITRGKRTIDSLITECDSVLKILNELKIEEMANVPMQKAFEKLYELVDEIHHLKEASMTWIKLEDFDDKKGFLYEVNAKCIAGPVFLVHSIGNKDFYSRVSIAGIKIFVHSLSSEECERGSNVPYVPMCIYPALSSYISECVASIKPLLEKGEIQKLIVAILSADRSALVEKFIFEIKQEPVQPFDIKKDPELSQLEEALRAFCLKLSISDSLLKPLPQDCSFTVQIEVPQDCHKDTEMAFPWIQPEDNHVKMSDSRIIPLKTLRTEICQMQLYVEENPQLKASRSS